jgi:hypothetical protein
VFRQVKQVVSYADDVYVWVYLDYVDRVLRYEAFVVGYDDFGRKSTLEFVLEEGVLDNIHEVPLIRELMRAVDADSAWVSSFRFTSEGRLITSPPLLQFYACLNNDQRDALHAYFAEREREIKKERRPRWTRMLRALGYDVIPSL